MKIFSVKAICFWMSLFLINLVAAGVTLGAEPAFTHGVASGDVTQESAVLWTRVDQDTKVKVEIAYDSSFNVIIFDDKEKARPEHDFTVKFYPDDLPANQTLYYRFHAGESTSDTGTFKTAPIPSVSSDVTIAFTADTDGIHFPDGIHPEGAPFFNNFEVLDRIREENPDVFVYLGDTIYADSELRPLLGQEPATTLEEFRDIYKETRSIAALPNLLKSTSTIAIWDDHEVEDDFDGETVDPTLFANGRQAFLEYMPMVEVFEVEGEDETCAGDPLVRIFKWGRDIELYVLDERSCRSASAELACLNDVDPGPGVTLVPDLAPTLPTFIRAGLGGFGIPLNPPAGCLETLNDPNRTLLGKGQKNFLKKKLLRSEAKFKLILNEIAMQQLYVIPYDHWEGYNAERTEVLSFIRDNNIENVIFLTTDLHTNIINEVFIDRLTDQETIAHEFITGPVATFTFAEGITQLLGPAGVNAFNSILNFLEVDCRNNDTDSYGMFEYDSETGEAQITLKDSAGNVVTDEIFGNPCQQSFGAAPLQLVNAP
jgi:alkaline phosphatase D